MKVPTRNCRLWTLAVISAIAAGSNVSANSFTMDLGQVIAGGFTAGDLSSAPYVVATFTDVAGGVQLNISNPGLGFAGSGSYEHIGIGAGHNGLLLNVTPAQIGHLTFAVQSTTISPTMSNGNAMPTGASITTFAVTQASNGYTSSPGKQFDINIPFAESDAEPSGKTEFGNGKSITYLITSSLAGGVTAADFDLKDSSGTYYVAAAIDDAKPGLYVAASGVTSNIQQIPDAGSTATLLALGLVGMGGLRAKLKKS